MIRAKWQWLYTNLGFYHFCFLNIWGAKKLKDKAAIFKQVIRCPVYQCQASQQGVQKLLSLLRPIMKLIFNSLMNLLNNNVHSDPWHAFPHQHNSYFYWIKFNEARTFWVSSTSQILSHRLQITHWSRQSLLQGPHNLVRLAYREVGNFHEVGKSPLTDEWLKKM